MASQRDREIELADQAQKMNVERIKSLDDMSRGLIERQTYFLITAAGACIGFALSKFDPHIHSVTRWAMLLALLSWGICFVSGIFHADIQIKQMKYNADQLRIDTRTGPYREICSEKQISLSGIRLYELGKFNRQGRLLWIAQYWSMLVGAILFIWAHIVMPFLCHQ